MVQNNRNTHQIGVRLILNFGCNVLPQFCRNRAAVNLLKAQSLEFRLCSIDRKHHTQQHGSGQSQGKQAFDSIRLFHTVLLLQFLIHV